jgi:hypothetical protein
LAILGVTLSARIVVSGSSIAVSASKGLDAISDVVEIDSSSEAGTARSGAA